MKTTSRILNWESHLVERAKLGERVAFELLADLYRPTLLNLSLRMLRNTDDAKDAVQDTYLKAFRALKDFDPLRPIKPWLCRICANCCVDIVRDRKREGDPLEQHEYMLQDTAESLDEQASDSIEQEEVREAINRLPEKYRKIIFMRHFRHMDVNEIAVALNKPEGTIKSWLFRARAILKKDLQVALSGS
jgi:RNA polymerase sigma-70 factor, ECF subfamily